MLAQREDMAGEKLNQLAEQINFLIKLEQEALEECVTEMGSLMIDLEKASAKEQNDQVEGGIELIKKTISEDCAKMSDELKQEIEFLSQQAEIVKQALTVKGKNEEAFAEIESLILEDVGQLEDNDSFKKRSLAAHEKNKLELLNMITDIREALNEGAIEDLAAYFEAVAMEEAEQNYSDQQDDSELSDEDDEDELDDCQDSCDTSDLLAAKKVKSVDADNLCSEEEFDSCPCSKEDGFDFSSNEKLLEMLKVFSDPAAIKAESEK